ncbi:MAG TPA: alpha/beta hydrolase [Terriglobia bacterium]|nr:alpha/beta hydrolase [Terriglobia bacterium]
MNPPDDPYRIRSYVSDFDAIAAGYRQASDRARQNWRQIADMSYGAHPDERLDLFFPPAASMPAPIHLFIHGGYWRANVKEDYAFLADTICGAGAIAAIVEYTLMPRARMERLVDQVRRAAVWIRENAANFDGDALALSASGHSAGAHLASYLAAFGPNESTMDLAPVRSLLLVSGIYDLAPIANSFLQEELHLTAEEIASWSPIQAEPAYDADRTIVVGGEETPPFSRDARELGIHMRACGATAPVRTIPQLNHMTILRDMAVDGSAMAKLLRDCIAGSRSAA